MKFDGTIRSLIHWYQTHEVSGYQDIRHVTRRNYDSRCRTLDFEIGDTRIDAIDYERLLIWKKRWTNASGVAMAHGLFAMLRILMKFGMTLGKRQECATVSALLGALRMPQGPAREAFVTADQADAIRAMAHQNGYPSIALAQAFQFELTLRQKDVIGEWVPEDEPGITDITALIRTQAGSMHAKWLRGIRWTEIDSNLILRHITSKKLKPVEFDLHESPMIMAELDLMKVRPLTGPVIIEDGTILPWQAHRFRYHWRRLARLAGVPDEVQNRDSRAGGITEATNASAALEDVRHMAAHSQVSMTARYSRDTASKVQRVQRLRAASRKPKQESA